MTPDGVRRGVRTGRHLLLALTLAAMLPVTAFGVFSVVAVLDGHRTAEEMRLRDVGQALASALDQSLASSFLALRVLASSRLLDAAPLDVAAFEERARRVGEDTGGWAVLQGPPPDYATLANARRRPGVSFPPTRPPEVTAAIEEPLRLVFEQQRTAVSNLFRGPTVEKLVVAAFVPVIRDERVTHALSVGLEPSGVRRLLLDQHLRDGVFAVVVDGNNRIIANSLEGDRVPVGSTVPDWMIPDLRTGNRSTLVGRGLLGSDNVYVVARLDLAPEWRVVVAQPVEMIRAAAWRSAKWLPLGGVALVLGTSIVVWAARREALLDSERETAALRAGRAETERLLGGLPAVIFLREVAPDGSSRPLYRGGDLATVLGWPSPGLAERPDFDDLVHPEDTTLPSQIANLMRDGHVSYQWRLRQPAGGWRILQTLVRVLARRPDGSAEIVGYTVDVSAHREAEARAMAAARLASLGEMAAGLAHEIKQPLQAISLAAEIGQIAARQGDVAEADRRFELIVEQTQRTANVIEHLRRFARGAEDGAPQQSVPLATAVEGALQLARSALRDASISVEVDLGDPPPLVRGQSVLLEQVLSNLLLNARDALAARPAGAPRRIRIAATPGADDMVRVTVADTGGGIAPEVMARLFEPFVTTKGPDKGTGLGLSICHGLIKGMGGSIEAHNDAEGAVLTITLPSATTDGEHAARRQEIAEIS